MHSKLTTWGLMSIVALAAIGFTACGDDTTNNDTIADANPGTILVAPNTIEFAATSIGEEDAQILTITNTTSGILDIRSITLAESNEGDSDREIVPGDDWKSSAELKQGELLNLTVKWKPLNNTPDSAVITIRSNDPQNPELKIPVNTPQLAPQVFSPEVISFSRVPAGTTQRQSSFIQNAGQAPLQLKDIFIVNPNSEFTISFPDPAAPSDPDKDKTTWPSPLAPNERIPIRVTFSPLTDNPSTDTLIIASNDPNAQKYEVKLSGNAGTPCIQLAGVSEVDTPVGDETHELKFGLSAIGRASNKTVQIENCSRTEKLNLEGITLSDNGGGVYELVQDALPDPLKNNMPLEIGPLETATFVVSYKPIDDSTSLGKIVISSDDPVNSELRVAVTGKGTDNECPVARATGLIQGSGGRPATALDTIPLKTIEFSGEDSSDPDGQVDRYEWKLVSAPTNSTSRFSPSNTVSKPKLFLDLAGEYEVELTVFDNLGLASCSPSKVLIRATPDEDIHVQLVWANNGTDLDLHYINGRGRWDVPGGDVFWRAPTADWGVPGNSNDDPSLDIDDTDGFGPENVNHNNPVQDAYGVGVHYYADNGLAASYATVRIYIQGVQKLEIREKYLEKEGVFWDVATIIWPSKEIVRRDRIFNGFPGR